MIFRQFLILAHQQLASDTTKTVVQDDDEDIVDYNIACEDIMWSAYVIKTWLHYRQD